MTSVPYYRPDVDGLRAVAVLLVVFYHFGFGPSGGFIGVDVFFVISGYLITQIVRKEINNGTFTLISFYERRIRRIYPALVTVVIFTIVCGWIMQTPADFKRLGYQASSATFGLSNFYFWRATGYFSPSAELMPLLHTWSLAVEEQFYLFWPLMLLISSRYLTPDRRSRGLLFILGGLILVSLTASIILVKGSSPTAFYMLPARAWELAVGALLTFAPAVRSRTLTEFTGFAGLILIVGWSFAIDGDTAFPGLFALPPVLGAMLLVLPHAHRGTVARFLSWQPMVFIGLLSYSLYLWHWPLLAFYRYAVEYSPSYTGLACLIGLTFVASYLSWRFVERPFRKSGPVFSLPSWSVPVGASAAVLMAATSIIAFSGIPGRLPPMALKFAAGETDISPKRNDCHGRPVAKSCTLGGQRADLAVWGDSHGVEVGYALSREREDRGGVLTITSSKCPPTLDYTPIGRPNCPKRNSEILAYLLDQSSVDTVLLIASYETYFAHDSSAFQDGFRRVVQKLEGAGKRVIISGPIPSLEIPVPTRAAVKVLRGDFTPLTISKASFIQSSANVVRMMDELENEFPSIRIANSSDAFCDDSVCRFTLKGRALFFDRHHPSVLGASLMVPILDSTSKMSLGVEE